MKLAYLAIPALIAGFSMTGCATSKATIGAVGSIAKAIPEDISSAKAAAEGFRSALKPTEPAPEPASVLLPAKVYTPVPEK